MRPLISERDRSRLGGSDSEEADGGTRRLQDHALVADDLSGNGGGWGQGSVRC